MKKTLYLMRHGQTLFNIQYKIQGWCDSPLTELGIRQSLAARQYFTDRNIVFDHAYCSTSERACDTVELVTDGQMPYTRLKDLREYGFGAFEGKDEFLNPARPYGDFFVQFGGEHMNDVKVRVNRCLSGIMSRPDHNCVLAVSHAGAIGNFSDVWKQYEQVERTNRLGNCGILKYEYEDGIFMLVEMYNPDAA